jgi:hypothetical protein
MVRIFFTRWSVSKRCLSLLFSVIKTAISGLSYSNPTPFLTFPISSCNDLIWSSWKKNLFGKNVITELQVELLVFRLATLLANIGMVLIRNKSWFVLEKVTFLIFFRYWTRIRTKKRTLFLKVYSWYNYKNCGSI